MAFRDLVLRRNSSRGRHHGVIAAASGATSTLGLRRICCPEEI
jgi:hypothetical protein